MNLRERYFENESVIITTINPTTTTSQPYTDMPMILVCQPGTTLSAGDVISFRDPEQQFDPNYKAVVSYTYYDNAYLA